MASDGPIRATADALRRALEQAHDSAWAMPGAFYTSEEWAAFERRALFSTEWVCVGRIEECAETGDYFTCDVAGESIVIVHGHDGKLRALSNVCRHRGMLVMKGRGHADKLVCPYHNWTYDTSGTLLRAPLLPVREDFDVANCGLPSLALDTWLGFVFVTLSEQPPPLADRLEGVMPLARNYHFESMRLRYVTEEVWPTNWKHLVENFMEGYHLSPLHRDTLHKINPTRLCKRYPAGEWHFGCLVGFARHLDGAGKGHADLSEEEANTSLMIAVPPGLLIGGGGDYSSFICLQPVDAASVRLKYGLIFHGEDWPDAVIDAAVELGRRTIGEDREALVGVQRGVGSRFYRPGPLAPADYEGTILDFFQYLGRRLLPTLDSAVN